MEPADSAKEKKRGHEKEAASYWGVAPTRVVKDDGTEWKWSCFRPLDTYEADVSIDLTKHHEPMTLGDKMARWTVKAMRWPTDIFFQRRYGCRAMMLETVAAVPGMVAGEVLHLRSLRRFEQSGGRLPPRVPRRLPPFPATAHHMVGYLEEEAVHSYTEFLRDIDAGKIENVPAPASPPARRSGTSSRSSGPTRRTTATSTTTHPTSITRDMR
ncbi:Alternative oxidase 1c, mitochondrial [Panicum miliaceum]|uniref:Ubiquinol oxidase n=1 Tax=Panicum miliaceum TaxID=4540 RepID=A0A3L6RNE1_PANMI|nr:Alternative oxidase 1c, mitochondrial [Panicum miliaceum]